MVAPEVQGIDLFKIANRSISGWIPSLKTGTTVRQPFIAEAGMEDDKRGDRNQARAEAARRLARFQQGTFWIGTD